MGDLHPLAVGGKGHGVVADDIAGAHGGKADGLAVPRTGLALATVYRHLRQVATQGPGHHLAHAQGRARGGVDLVAVMGLVDLDIHFISQHPRRHIQ